ncbi:MAG: RluA family pseudouridine synthase [Oscillospiraceae bacterium]|jgi:23S rRNA pseudouridine1911/1915/1917 synthase|nr:RluA family pseudouridine synthase [Oscillospiraceae bacterium]
MPTLTFTVAPEEHGRQVQQVLRGHGVSVRLMHRLKRVPGGMTRNGGGVARTVDPVCAGEVLTLQIPADDTVPEAIACALDIVYEDDDLLVINKPPTLPMHPSHNHQGDTLANAVAAYLAARGQPAAFRAAGRLDKGTSGLVVCCKHAYAASRLNGQARVQKTYEALAHGELHGSGIFRSVIYRPFKNRTLRACRGYEDPRQPGDESAVTHWEALACGGGVTLLRLWLETGRTHQIRVHFAHNKTPLLGDDFYGAPPREEPGHFLHCAKACFAHPVTEERMEFCAPPPAAFLAVAKAFYLN